MSAEGRDVRRRLCPHCSKSVSFKTYKAHRRLFYDTSEDQWLLSSCSELEMESSQNDETPPTSFGEQDDGHISCTDCAPSQNYDDAGMFTQGWVKFLASLL